MSFSPNSWKFYKLTEICIFWHLPERRQQMLTFFLHNRMKAPTSQPSAFIVSSSYGDLLV